jgi:hypothetical protein
MSTGCFDVLGVSHQKLKLHPRRGSPGAAPPGSRFDPVLPCHVPWIGPDEGSRAPCVYPRTWAVVGNPPPVLVDDGALT